MFYRNILIPLAYVLSVCLIYFDKFQIFFLKWRSQSAHSVVKGRPWYGRAHHIEMLLFDWSTSNFSMQRVHPRSKGKLMMFRRARVCITDHCSSQSFIRKMSGLAIIVDYSCWPHPAHSPDDELRGRREGNSFPAASRVPAGALASGEQAGRVPRLRAPALWRRDPDVRRPAPRGAGDVRLPGEGERTGVAVQ